MGRALGCLGHVIALRRTRVSSFVEGDAVAMATLQSAAEEVDETAQRLLLPVEAALSTLAVLRVDQSDAARLLRGQAVLVRGRDAPTHGGATYATCKGQLIAVGRVEKGRTASDPRVQFRRRRIMRSNQAFDDPVFRSQTARIRV